jgi:hypothetical protein
MSKGTGNDGQVDEAEESIIANARSNDSSSLDFERTIESISSISHYKAKRCTTIAGVWISLGNGLQQGIGCLLGELYDAVFRNLAIYQG